MGQPGEHPGTLAIGARVVSGRSRYPASVVWEAIFLLAVLKIPVVYVCAVVWWAIRAEPKPYDGLEPAALAVPPETDPRPGSLRSRRPRPFGGRTHGRPLRTYRRRRAYAQTRVRP